MQYVFIEFAHLEQSDDFSAAPPFTLQTFYSFFFCDSADLTFAFVVIVTIVFSQTSIHANAESICIIF